MCFPFHSYQGCCSYPQIRKYDGPKQLQMHGHVYKTDFSGVLGYYGLDLVRIWGLEWCQVVIVIMEK